MLAETDLAYGLDEAARETLAGKASRFGLLQLATWTSIVPRAAELCDWLSENRLLLPEVDRGLAWLAVPDVVKYHTGLREVVRDLAIQTARGDVAVELRSDVWPGAPANGLVDACRLAAWAGDVAGLRRELPAARRAIAAVMPGPHHLRKSIGYWLTRACVRAGLLPEGAELCEEFGFPAQATDGLVIALSAATDRDLYTSVRDRWLTARTEAFRAERSNHHWRSWELRSCAGTLGRLGDEAGYRKAIRQFREVVAAWTPTHDSFACAVNCDLAVLFDKAGETQLASDHLNTAKRLFDGREPSAKPERGSRSRMASILSAAYCDLGDVDLALRYAKTDFTHA
jgi:hypothetical protein